MVFKNVVYISKHMMHLYLFFFLKTLLIYLFIWESVSERAEPGGRAKVLGEARCPSSAFHLLSILSIFSKVVMISLHGPKYFLVNLFLVIWEFFVVVGIFSFIISFLKIYKM